jgi:hypothetical protein
LFPVTYESLLHGGLSPLLEYSGFPNCRLSLSEAQSAVSERRHVHTLITQILALISSFSAAGAI